MTKFAKLEKIKRLMFWWENCQTEFKLFLTHNLAHVFRPKKFSQLPEAQLYLKTLSSFIHQVLFIKHYELYTFFRCPRWSSQNCIYNMVCVFIILNRYYVKEHVHEFFFITHKYIYSIMQKCKLQVKKIFIEEIIVVIYTNLISGFII